MCCFYRRVCCLTVLLVLMALAGISMGASSGQNWIPFRGPQVERDVMVSVTAADARQVDIEITIPGIHGETIMTPEGEFSRLAFLSEGFTTDIGQPQLPILTRWVEIPAGAQAYLEVVTCQTDVISLADMGIDDDIIPVQPPVPKVPGAWEKAVFRRDDAFYAQDRWYPADVTQLGSVDQIRGHQLVPLKIYPVRYNPRRRAVSICTELHLRIHLQGADLEETRRMAQRWQTPVFEKALQQTLLNRGCYTEKDVPILPVGYLIITHDSYYDQILPLAQWKTEKGFEVTVTKLSEISPQTASGIKSYIQNAYNNWPVPPTYVLLVGDVGNIPTFTGSSSTTETDLPYGDMTGIYLPEIQVGRFSCSSTAEASAAVNKTLDYEKTDLATLSWFDDAVFMASSDQNCFAEGTHNYVIDNYLEPNGYTCYKVYQCSGGGTSGITSNLNAGRAIANYSGHGNATAWAGPAFSISNINALTNADRYPFVIGNACLTGDIGYSECFGEHWLNVADKGAIAYWGSSNSTYWNEDDILEKRMYRAIFEDELFTFAGFTNQAKWYTYQYYSGGGMSRYYYECYILLGDPSAELPTAIPAALIVSHPGTISLGTVTKVIVTVTRSGSVVQDALVCAHQDGGVHQAAYSDAFGEAALYLLPTITDTILVTVTAHNGRPYQGAIIPLEDVPPAPVSDLFTYLANSAVMLAWSAVTTDTLANPKTVSAYAVYRDAAHDFEPSIANSLAATSATDYLDPTAAVGDTTVQHYYKVIAIGAGGQKSEPSQAAGEFDRHVIHEGGQPKGK